MEIYDSLLKIDQETITVKTGVIDLVKEHEELIKTYKDIGDKLISIEKKIIGCVKPLFNENDEILGFDIVNETIGNIISSCAIDTVEIDNHIVGRVYILIGSLERMPRQYLSIKFVRDLGKEKKDNGLFLIGKNG